MTKSNKIYYNNVVEYSLVGENKDEKIQDFN